MSPSARVADHGADDLLDKYIPMGCIQVQLDSNQGGLQQALQSLSHLQDWHHLDVHNSPSGSQPVRKALLLSHPLSPFARLVDRKWIRLSLKLDPENPTRFTVRVFILPDDIDNNRIPRSDGALHKTRRKLISQLDYSPYAWAGKFNPGVLLTPPSDADDGEGPSLLELFNTIPSPDPSEQTIQDPDYAGAIESVMDSDIYGLETTLYPYQRRSIAVMLQREAETRPILDPRLTVRWDHSNRKWYHDPINGTVLREPRYYDSPRGGILAEEMGSGKTLMCLALCLATQHMPARIPEAAQMLQQEDLTEKPTKRQKMRSLSDMAAACVTRGGVSWKPRLEGWSDGLKYDNCIEAVKRNPGFYTIRQLPRRRNTRFSLTSEDLPPTHIYLSHASLVVVPLNLFPQWVQEIKKHTTGLKIFYCSENSDNIPPPKELLDANLVLMSSSAFAQLAKDRRNMPDGTVQLDNPLARVHFKRCIVDEGHRLGNSASNQKLDLQAVLDCLHYTARWIVTGTPSKGLFGLEELSSLADEGAKVAQSRTEKRRIAQSTLGQEKDDLRRLGAIAKHYLKMQPWAQVPGTTQEAPAEWGQYVMLPKHSKKSVGRPEALKATVESLIIRHRLTDVKKVLPKVKERIVYLDPCYQDILVLNIFSMMIIFNSVQSQRTDQDYFFHPRQRKALDQLVSNLSQASFFGGSFFSFDDLSKAIDTAEKFLAEKKVQISGNDDALLRQAISFGRLAVNNNLKNCANRFHEVPVSVNNFPFHGIQPSIVYGWSLDNYNYNVEPVCMSANLIGSLQQTFESLCRRLDCHDSQDEVWMEAGPNHLALDGFRNIQKRAQSGTPDSDSARAQRPALAGNTQLGEDKTELSKKTGRSAAALREEAAQSEGEDGFDGDVPEPFSRTQMTSTASAKLSYLVDQIVRYHRDEQILVFYDNDNIAYYLAEVLEVLSIKHLIYAKGISQRLKAEYVAAFTAENSKVRVMLMDINQAAFGLNMQTASRIYFINPVFKRQVEAQAVGRARRIGQLAESVTVETLVLKGSMEELIVKRRAEMSQQEQQKCQSVIDDKHIYDWILNARILPLPGSDVPLKDSEQMAKLEVPQLVFRQGVGRKKDHGDKELDGLGLVEQPTPIDQEGKSGLARRASVSGEEPKAKRVRFADD